MVAVSLPCFLATFFMLIATVALGLSALPPSLRISFVDSSVYLAILIGGPLLLGFFPFHTSRAPSVFTIGPSWSFLQRTPHMPLRGLSKMGHVVPCLLTLSPDIRISVRFLSFLLPFLLFSFFLFFFFLPFFFFFLSSSSSSFLLLLLPAFSSSERCRSYGQISDR